MTQSPEQQFVPYSPSKLPAGSTLIFAPHPDDEVFGCGGAIIRHLQHGDRLKVVIVTDGGFPLNESQKTADYPEIRKQESLTAAKIIGYCQPLFLDFKDGFLKADEILIARLLEIIREFQPQNIYLPSETEIHPDHIALYKAGLAAAYRYQGPVSLVFYEVGQMQKANLLLDITDIHDILNRAMDCFSSQLKVQNYKYHINALHAYRTYTLGNHVKSAEAYFVKSINKHTINTDIWESEILNPEIVSKSLLKDTDYPLISVIVRTMNIPLLQEAIASLSRQTYPNLEIIVVDAHGTNSIRHDIRCGNFPVRIVSEQRPLQRAAAANAGMREVNGAFFGFLDEDDLLFPHHFANLFNVLNNSNAPAAYTNIKRVNSNNEFLNLYDEDFKVYKLLYYNFIPIHALLFRTDPVKAICSFDDIFDIFEDWDFLLQVSHLGNFIHLNETTGVYRDFNTSGVQDQENRIMNYRSLILEKWKNKLFNPSTVIQTLVENNRLINDKNAEIEANEKEIMAINSRVNSLETELFHVTNSLSWRLTKPLRLPLIKKIAANYRTRKILRKLKNSRLFNEDYYLKNNPDVAISGFDPLQHYLVFGAMEGRKPSADFDGQYYLSQYPDVKVSGMNPLVHYLLHGKREGRQPLYREPRSVQTIDPGII